MVKRTFPHALLFNQCNIWEDRHFYYYKLLILYMQLFTYVSLEFEIDLQACTHKGSKAAHLTLLAAAELLKGARYTNSP